VKSINTIKR